MKFILFTTCFAHRIFWTSSVKPVTIKDFRHPTGPTTIVPNSPLGIFHLFFTIDILQHIVTETNKYALQCIGEASHVNWVEVTVEELEAYFGIVILMGLVRLPTLRDYWKRDPTYHYAPIATAFSRDRFFELSRYLHFEDNNNLAPRGTATYNRLGKVQHITNLLTTRFETVFNLNKEVAVDEAMIKFKGRSTIKQYMPKKPIKRGIKAWVLADSKTGYISRLDLYKGKNGNNTDKGLGSNVKNLCQNIKHK